MPNITYTAEITVLNHVETFKSKSLYDLLQTIASKADLERSPESLLGCFDEVIPSLYEVFYKSKRKDATLGTSILLECKEPFKQVILSMSINLYNTREVFVFGSNTAGIHGAGAAKEALKHGAILGVGEGFRGHSYAIPTKSHYVKGNRAYVGEPLSLRSIYRYVTAFLDFAEEHPEYRFNVTRIGCGLAGFRDEDIAPMFTNAPLNCLFDDKWKQYLDASHHLFWGSYDTIPFKE